jgi:hypothetical protein
VHYPRRLLRVLSPEEVARLREEEAQRHRRTVHARRLHSGCGLVNLIAAQVLAGCRIGRAAQELGKVLDVADIIVLRLLAELADRHVLDHAATQRLMGFSLIGGSCLEVGVLDPSFLKTERLGQPLPRAAHLLMYRSPEVEKFGCRLQPGECRACAAKIRVLSGWDRC